MSDLLDPVGVYRDAEYVCQHCDTHCEVFAHKHVAGQCPACGSDPGSPEVIG